MKISRAEALRQVKWGGMNDRDDKAPMCLSWAKGRMLEGPSIRAIIENALSRQERLALRRVLKAR